MRAGVNRISLGISPNHGKAVRSSPVWTAIDRVGDDSLRMNDFPQAWSTLRVALAHDWLTGMRGGERVLEILCEAFPDAPIHTLIHNPDAISAEINRHLIHTSILQRFPRVVQTYRYYLPFYPWAVRQLKPAPADLLISSSHCVAKGVARPPSGRHLCYCFTPMRYAWTFYTDYFGSNPLKKAVLKPVLAGLRRWDRKHAANVDRFVAISGHVRRRIQAFYGRDADIVYPPVDTNRCTPDPQPGHDDFDLVVSALVPYKRIDLAVAAYSRSGYPLVVVGTGTEYQRLQANAAPNVTFRGWLPDDDILALYRRCRLLIFPGEEDFGIVPVEAQACGKPVVAFDKGGATETLVAGETAQFFEEQSAAALWEAVTAAAAQCWDPVVIRRNAERFSVAAFISGMDASIRRCLEGEADA